jgi:anti-repressor protein
MTQQNEQAVEPLAFSYHAMNVRALRGPDGDPRIVAQDVAQVLGYDRMTNMIRMLEADERGSHIVSTPGGPQQMTVLTESGLYHAIFHSRRPEAGAFRKWVTAEVLPQIRKTGAYVADPSAMSRRQMLEHMRDLATAGLEAEHRAEALAARNRQLEPRAAVTDRPVAAVAKELGLGPNKLFAFLRERGVLRSDRNHWNLPRQRHIDEGRLTIKVTPYTDGKGRDRVSRSPLVTGRGLAYIERLAAKHGLFEEATCAS